MDENKEYLGDSVYISMDTISGIGVWLTTENGYGPTNKIYLEDHTYYALKRYWERVLEKKSE